LPHFGSLSNCHHDSQGFLLMWCLDSTPWIHIWLVLHVSFWICKI
jgi:hypothetical protein